jgi:hypothetical protein
MTEMELQSFDTLSAMQLEGSCHCGAVSFSVRSHEPVPYQRCYCSICRKTGSGGFMINLAADAATLKTTGLEHSRTYRAQVEGNGTKVESKHQRIFCSHCGSHLWAFNEQWPELLHPVASAIDTELPVAPERVHMMLGSKATWVEPDDRPGDGCFETYPEQSIADWHKTRGLRVD